MVCGNADREGRGFLRAREKMPVLLSAADDDGGAVELMKWLYSLSTNPGSKFVEYPNGGHGVDTFAAHKELPEKIGRASGRERGEISVVAGSLKKKKEKISIRTMMREKK